MRRSGMDAELEALAEAHGVATWYEDWRRERKDVAAESVIGVLGLLGVDASTPAAVTAELAAVRRARAEHRLPGTVVVREGEQQALAAAGMIMLEDGSERWVTEIPDDLPLGWHRLN